MVSQRRTGEIRNCVMTYFLWISMIRTFHPKSEVFTWRMRMLHLMIQQWRWWQDLLTMKRWIGEVTPPGFHPSGSGIRLTRLSLGLHFSMDGPETEGRDSVLGLPLLMDVDLTMAWKLGRLAGASEVRLRPMQWTYNSSKIWESEFGNFSTGKGRDQWS